MSGIIQILSGSIISLPNFVLSFSLVWPSYSIKMFESDHTPLEGYFSSLHEGLLGSLMMLGCFVATPLAGYVVNDLGRKRTLMLAGAVLVVSFCIICTAKHVTTVLLGRFLIGVGSGLQMGAAAMMVEEISEVAMRGRLSAICNCMYSFGILTSYVMGWFCSYDIINYFLLTLCVIYMLLMSSLKESPNFLLKIQQNDKAIDSLKFYRGETIPTQSILDEITAMEALLHFSNSGANANSYSENVKSNNLEVLTSEIENDIVKRTAWDHLKASKSSQRALITACLLVSLMVFMGTTAVQSNADQIFNNAVPGLSSSLCAVTLAVAFVLGTFFSASLCDLLGRRNLILTSCSLVMFFQILLSSMIRWSWAPEWMIPVVIFLYSFSFQFGAGGIPGVLISEIFTPEVKAISTVIFSCTLWISNFILLSIFSYCVQIFGTDGMFFIFALVGTVEMAVAYLILPETSGLSSEDIQEKFAKGFIQIKRK